MRITQRIKIFLVPRQDEIVGRYKDFAGRSYMPATFYRMIPEIDPVKIIILFSAHHLITGFIPITPEKKKFIGIVRRTRGGKKTGADRITGKDSLLPFVRRVIIPQKIIVITIGAIPAEQIEFILLQIIKDVVMMQLIRPGIMTHRLPLQIMRVHRKRSDTGRAFLDIEQLIYIAFVLAGIENTLAQYHIH